MDTINTEQLAQDIAKHIAPQKLWLDTTDLEEEFGIGKVRQATLRSERRIPFSKIGRFIKYNRNEINQWFADAKVC